MFGGQILIYKRTFPKLQFLQIPMTVIFSLFIDAIMLVLTVFSPHTYFTEIIFVLTGCLSVGLGIALQVIGNIIMLPGDGFVYALAKRINFDFGKTKVSCDIILVLLAFALSFIFFGNIIGLREGTLISAVTVGMITRFFIKSLTIPDDQGNLQLRWLLK